MINRRGGKSCENALLHSLQHRAFALLFSSDIILNILSRITSAYRNVFEIMLATMRLPQVRSPLKCVPFPHSPLHFVLIIHFKDCQRT